MQKQRRRRTRAATTSAALFAAIIVAEARAQSPPAGTAAAPAGKATVISPIYGQLVAFSVPLSFGVISEQSKPDHYIREAVPKGETVDKWTEMITVAGRKGVASNPAVTPQRLVEAIASAFKRACEPTFIAKGIQPFKIGAYNAFAAIASCGAVGTDADKHSETTLIIAVKGSSDYYTIQWAERAVAAPGPIPIDDKKWFSRLADLGPIKLCPIVPGERAPFVSCLGSKKT